MRRDVRASRWMWWKRRRSLASSSRSKFGSTEVAHVPDERLRFQEFGFQRLANGRCRAKVVLTWSDGRRFEGSSDGVSSQTGELRCCAVAAVNALEQAVQPRLTFELLGVKAVRASNARTAFTPSNSNVSRGCTACSNAFTAATAQQRSSPVCDETPSDDPSKRRPSDHVSTTLARQRPLASR